MLRRDRSHAGTTALEGRYLHGPSVDEVLAYWRPSLAPLCTVAAWLWNVRDVPEINGSTVTVVLPNENNQPPRQPG